MEKLRTPPGVTDLRALTAPPVLSDRDRAEALAEYDAES